MQKVNLGPKYKQDTLLATRSWQFSEGGTDTEIKPMARMVCALIEPRTNVLGTQKRVWKKWTSDCRLSASIPPAPFPAAIASSWRTTCFQRGRFFFPASDVESETWLGQSGQAIPLGTVIGSGPPRAGPIRVKTETLAGNVETKAEP